MRSQTCIISIDKADILQIKLEKNDILNPRDLEDYLFESVLK